MATTFFKENLGGQKVFLTSFYGGIKRGRCVQIGISSLDPITVRTSNKEVTAATVKAMRAVLKLRIAKRGGFYYLGVGDNAVMLDKKEMRKFDAALAKWESGEPLRDIL